MNQTVQFDVTPSSLESALQALEAAKAAVSKAREKQKADAEAKTEAIRRVKVMMKEFGITVNML